MDYDYTCSNCKFHCWKKSVTETYLYCNHPLGKKFVNDYHRCNLYEWDGESKLEPFVDAADL